MEYYWGREGGDKIQTRTWVVIRTYKKCYNQFNIRFKKIIAIKLSSCNMMKCDKIKIFNL